MKVDHQLYILNVYGTTLYYSSITKTKRGLYNYRSLTLNLQTPVTPRFSSKNTTQDKRCCDVTIQASPSPPNIANRTSLTISSISELRLILNMRFIEHTSFPSGRGAHFEAPPIKHDKRDALPDHQLKCQLTYFIVVI